MDEGIVPHDWKCANISPLFKKGNRNLADNYRPVSLTSLICKLFESIIHDALVRHLEDNRLLNIIPNYYTYYTHYTYYTQHGSRAHNRLPQELCKNEVIIIITDEQRCADSPGSSVSSRVGFNVPPNTL